MPFYEVQGKRPQIGATSYVHPTAVLIGDVVIGEGCWIGPHVTMRADEGTIRMGDYSNFKTTPSFTAERWCWASTHTWDTPA